MNEEYTMPEEKEISLKDLILNLKKVWLYLLTKWIYIVFFAAAGAVIGLVYAYIKKPVYKAELSFALDDDKSSGGLGGALGLASQFGFDLGSSGGSVFAGDNLMELMKSRSMVEKTLLTKVIINKKNTTLAEQYISFNKLREGWAENGLVSKIKFLPDTNRSNFTLQQDSILGVFYSSIIKNNLTVDKVDKKLSIITVTVTSKNEIFSKLFAEVLVKTVSNFYIYTKIRKSVQNVNILQHQTDSVRRELNAAITGVASSVDVNPNANPALQVLRVPSQRRQVDVQANTAILTQLVANLEVAKVSLRKETPLIQTIDIPILPLEKDVPGKLKSLLIGGFIMGTLAIAILVIRKVFKHILT